MMHGPINIRKGNNFDFRACDCSLDHLSTYVHLQNCDLCLPECVFAMHCTIVHGKTVCGFEVVMSTPAHQQPVGY